MGWARRVECEQKSSVAVEGLDGEGHVCPQAGIGEEGYTQTAVIDDEHGKQAMLASATTGAR